jgi:hypothetical protein
MSNDSNDSNDSGMNAVPVRHPRCGIVAMLEKDIAEFARLGTPVERVPMDVYELNGERIEFWPGTHQMYIPDGAKRIFEVLNSSLPLEADKRETQTYRQAEVEGHHSHA